MLIAHDYYPFIPSSPHLLISSSPHPLISSSPHLIIHRNIAIAEQYLQQYQKWLFVPINNS
jgi:hypothetical protein